MSASRNWSTIGAAVRRPGVWLALVGVFLLSGCGAALDGIAGVTVDSNGRPQGLVQNCKRPMETASVRRTDGPTDEKGLHQKLGRWSFTRSTVGKPVTWTFAATEAKGVAATVPFQAMVAGRTYSFGAGSKDHWTSTVDVEFTLHDLEGLTPGRVLINYPGEHPREVSVAQFSDHACDHS